MRCEAEIDETDRLLACLREGCVTNQDIIHLKIVVSITCRVDIAEYVDKAGPDAHYSVGAKLVVALTVQNFEVAAKSRHHVVGKKLFVLDKD